MKYKQAVSVMPLMKAQRNNYNINLQILFYYVEK